MTLAVMALYAQGTTRLTHIASWRVKETDRIAAMATELRKLGATVTEGAGFHRGHAPATTPGAPRPSTPTTTIASRCVFHSPPSTRWALRRPVPAGAHPRPAAVWARLFPTISKPCSAWRGLKLPTSRSSPSTAPPHPARARWRARLRSSLGYHFLDSGARLPRHCAHGAAMRAGIPETDEAGLARTAGGLQLHGSPTSASGSRVKRSATQLRREEVGAMASKVSVWPAVRAALLELQHWRTAACPAWWPMGATWGRSSSPAPTSRCL